MHQRALPRVGLCLLPTPLHPMRHANRVVPAVTREVLVKRDDLIGYAAAGNKARMLEFIVGEALASGTQTVVGCGMTTSNYIASLAQACADAGLACEIHVPEPLTPTPSALLAREAGARVVAWPVSRHDLDGIVEERAAELRSEGIDAVWLPRGGATAEAALGFALAAREVSEQLAPREGATLLVPVGAGATAAGLIAGLAQLRSTHHVIGVSVALPLEEVRANILTMARGALQLLDPGADHPDPAEWLTLVDREDGTDDADLEVVRRMLRHSGLMVPDRYGPPTARELVRVAADGSDRAVVLWHTGGMLGYGRLLDSLGAR